MRRVTRSITSLLVTLPILIYYRNLELYLVLLLSIAFHELGHAVAALILGYQFDVRFSLGGGSVQLLGDDKNLKDLDLFMIVLMGPLFTLLLISCSFAAIRSGFEIQVISQILVINIFGIFFNMMPIVMTDGALTLGVIHRATNFLVKKFELFKESKTSNLIAWLISLTTLLLVVSIFCSLCYEIVTIEGQSFNLGFQTLMKSDLLLNLTGLDPFN